MWLITKKKEGDRLIVSLIIKRRPFKFTLLEIIKMRFKQERSFEKQRGNLRSTKKR